MRITTYATLATMLRTEDPDICEALGLLTDVCVVKEVPMRVRRPGRAWWRLPHLTVGYSVLWFIGNTVRGPEWQIVNFYREATGTAINTVVTKELVLAYLYGCVARQGGETC